MTSKEIRLYHNTNRPFAAGGHMVQNPNYWRAKECARLQNKTQLTRKVWFFFVYISQWSLVTFFCSPIFWILYHVTSSCKGPIGIVIEVNFLWRHFESLYLHFFHENSFPTNTTPAQNIEYIETTRNVIYAFPFPGLFFTKGVLLFRSEPQGCRLNVTVALSNYLWFSAC